MDLVALSVFLKSALIGVLIAAPVGPVGLLTMQRTLERGWAAGLATGLGAALADAMYGAVGAYGVHGLIDWLSGARIPLALGGGALLLVMAWRTWHAPVAHTAAAAPHAQGLLGLAAGTLALTLANPATIVSFIAVFGSLGSGLQGGALPSPLWMVAGVLLGSTAWWLLLTGAMAWQRRRFTPTWRQRINRASALLLAGFALWQWWQLA